MLVSKKIPLEFQSNLSKFKKPHRVKVERAIKFYTKTDVSPFVSQNIKFMTIKQLLSVLKIIKPQLKKISRSSRLKIVNWPINTLTCKPKDIRMGRGKGVPVEKVAVVGDTALLALTKAPYFKTCKLLQLCALKIHKSKYLKIGKW